MKDSHKDFMAAFDRFLEKTSVADAMSVATTIFISLVTSYVAHKGADANNPITIDWIGQRDITIHPPKGKGGGQ